MQLPKREVRVQSFNKYKNYTKNLLEEQLRRYKISCNIIKGLIFFSVEASKDNIDISEYEDGIN